MTLASAQKFINAFKVSRYLCSYNPSRWLKEGIVARCYVIHGRHRTRSDHRAWCWYSRGGPSLCANFAC
jgi:hypothetical protein